MQCSDRFDGSRPFSRERRANAVGRAVPDPGRDQTSKCPVPVITRAAAFNTRCNLSVTVLGAPARTVLQ